LDQKLTQNPGGSTATVCPAIYNDTGDCGWWQYENHTQILKAEISKWKFLKYIQT
jgi:hypothetical protein